MITALNSFASWLWNDVVKPALSEVTHRVAASIVSHVVELITEAAIDWIARLVGWTERLIDNGASAHDARVAATNRLIAGLSAISAKAELYRDSDAIDRLPALFDQEAAIIPA